MNNMTQEYVENVRLLTVNLESRLTVEVEKAKKAADDAENAAWSRSREIGMKMADAHANAVRDRIRAEVLLAQVEGELAVSREKLAAVEQHRDVLSQHLRSRLFDGLFDHVESIVERSDEDVIFERCEDCIKISKVRTLVVSDSETEDTAASLRWGEGDFPPGFPHPRHPPPPRPIDFITPVRNVRRRLSFESPQYINEGLNVFFT